MERGQHLIKIINKVPKNTTRCSSPHKLSYKCQYQMNCNKLNPVTIKTSVQTDTKQNLFDIDPNSDVEIITVMPLFKNCNSGNSEAEKCNSTLIEHQESG